MYKACLIFVHTVSDDMHSMIGNKTNNDITQDGVQAGDISR